METVSDVPEPFQERSPEAMIVFMYDRCQRRHDDATTIERRNLYSERLALLRDLMRSVKGADDSTRFRANQMLLTISDISEDEDSPLHGASLRERHEAIREAGDAHQWVQGFLGNQNPGGASSSSHVNAVADQMISMISGQREDNEEESDRSSDEIMESQSERLRRYMDSEMCEVSDPDEWRVLHYGQGSPSSNTSDEHDGR
eukprot:s332_g56.t2